MFIMMSVLKHNHCFDGKKVSRRNEVRPNSERESERTKSKEIQRC